MLTQLLLSKPPAVLIKLSLLVKQTYLYYKLCGEEKNDRMC